MNTIATEFDKSCLQQAVDLAKQAFAAGDFPVGAILVIDEQVIDTAGNEKNTQKTRTAHAENILIISNCAIIKDAHKENKVVKLYTTLEPCIQCLGASVSNRVNQVFFIQRDAIGGACGLSRDGIGSWYKDNWPEIHHVQYSDEARKLLVNYFEKEMAIDNTNDWYKKCFEYYSTH